MSSMYQETAKVPYDVNDEATKRHFAELVRKRSCEYYTTTFNSSVIKKAEYVVPLNLLEIEFTNGKAYTYYGIRPHVWNRFVDAESAGRFFNKEIRNNYSCSREMSRVA